MSDFDELDRLIYSEKDVNSALVASKESLVETMYDTEPGEEKREYRFGYMDGMYDLIQAGFKALHEKPVEFSIPPEPVLEDGEFLVSEFYGSLYRYENDRWQVQTDNGQWVTTWSWKNLLDYVGPLRRATEQDVRNSDLRRSKQDVTIDADTLSELVRALDFLVTSPDGTGLVPQAYYDAKKALDEQV